MGVRSPGGRSQLPPAPTPMISRRHDLERTGQALRRPSRGGPGSSFGTPAGWPGPTPLRRSCERRHAALPLVPRQDAEPVSRRNRLGARPNVELRQDGRDVMVHRLG
jgi:hypothetical protein